MSEFEIYRRAERRVRLKLALEIHAIIFFILNSSLIVVNLIFMPNLLWFVIVLLSWGLGLIIHALTLIVKGGKRLGLAIHASSFVMVESMLIYVNLTFLPNYFWSLFPLIAFILSLTTHATIHYLVSRRIEDPDKKSWYVKRIEKEAKKIKKELNGIE